MSEDTGALSVREEHQSYSGIAERQIRSMVLTGHLGPGERINELELSDTFEISRGPIREAIQRLATEGLLEMRPHRGAVVRSFDRRELAELFGLRIALETFAVREGTVKATEGQLRVLASLLNQNDETQSEPPTADLGDSLGFHRSLVLTAGSVALLEAHSAVMQKITIATHQASVGAPTTERAVDEHRMIVAAMADRDGDIAARLLEHHIRAALARLEATAEGFGYALS